MSIIRPHREEEVQEKQPPYRLTYQQDKCLEEINSIVGYDEERAIGPGAGAGAGPDTQEWTMGGTASSHNSDSKSEDGISEELAEKLQKKVLALILALLNHNLGDNKYQSALISGMAVLGVSAETGWLSPLMYTPKQSAIITVARILVLY
jgi:hypothetical protein